MKLDSHQHFWKYDPLVHEWITDEMAVIRKDFLPGDLLPLLQQQSIDGCVAVQADQSSAETDFLCGLARKHEWIRGVVGWTDLRSPAVSDQLAMYSGQKEIKGFRHVLQGEHPEFMLQPDFLKGIAALEAFGFTYDILIFPEHLAAAATLVERFPRQPFVLDHIAKPRIAQQLFGDWKEGVERLAQYPNVSCKISGMVTEANWTGWRQADFEPYLDIVTEAFGVSRLMYGSDWPVCQVAADYGGMLNIVKKYYAAFSASEQAAIFGANAQLFYNIK